MLEAAKAVCSPQGELPESILEGLTTLVQKSLLQRSLGADAPPCSYEDIEQADCLLIAGSNMAYAHPILFRRLEAAKAARP